MAVQLLTKPEEWNVQAGNQVGGPDVGQCTLADAILELYLVLHMTADTVSAWQPILQTALDDGANCCFRREYGAEEKSLLEMAFANTFRQKSLLLLQRLLERGARVHKLRRVRGLRLRSSRYAELGVRTEFEHMAFKRLRVVL